ncbi:aminoglycoside phosphotransferase family protein [Rossellomorea sp. BNER]|uniref:aminoglycoside phosphotransferase family protein n=1 Tax=Rossellomorea sp. BNER TaxID=2962031 RepID=UPI003AF30670|nr:aminoglycoside phosphotransferase family protein [Rossellomorea sp. BNER]
MDISDIIKTMQDKGLVDRNDLECESLSGGTTSQLYLVNQKYVIKINEPNVLEAESVFLQFYKNVPLLPLLIFVDPSYQYIVYEFIPGSTTYSRKNKSEILHLVVRNIINHYQSVPGTNGWGWKDELSTSWQNFLLEGIMESKIILEQHLDFEDLKLVQRLAESSNRIPSKGPYLLHGDCGVHNFVFKDGCLSGVIDPTPVLGDPLYDLLYAFCSSPNELTKETIDSVIPTLKVGEYKCGKVLYEYLVIVLFMRLATCLRHHADDFEEYLYAWDYWKRMI